MTAGTPSLLSSAPAAAASAINSTSTAAAGDLTLSSSCSEHMIGQAPSVDGSSISSMASNPSVVLLRSSHSTDSSALALPTAGAQGSIVTPQNPFETAGTGTGTGTGTNTAPTTPITTPVRPKNTATPAKTQPLPELPMSAVNAASPSPNTARQQVPSRIVPSTDSMQLTAAPQQVDPSSSNATQMSISQLSPPSSPTPAPVIALLSTFSQQQQQQQQQRSPASTTPPPPRTIPLMPQSAPVFPTSGLAVSGNAVQVQPVSITARPLPASERRAPLPPHRAPMQQATQEQQQQQQYQYAHDRNMMISQPVFDDDENTEPSSAANTADHMILGHSQQQPQFSDHASGGVPTEQIMAGSFTRFLEQTRRRFGVNHRDAGHSLDDDLDLDHAAVLICGYLQKLGRNGKWQTRWFETDGECLSYYKSNKRTKLLATLDLEKVGVIEIDESDSQHRSFTIQVLGRLYHLRAGTRASCKDWVITLNRVKEARLQQGNMKLVQQPPIDLLDDEMNQNTGSLGGGRTDGSGNPHLDHVTPRLVVVANRQRTRAVAESEDFTHMIYSEETPSAVGMSNTANHGRIPASYGSHGRRSAVGAAVLARWTKQQPTLNRFGAKLSKWARSILSCMHSDAVELDQRVHPPGHGDDDDDIVARRRVSTSSMSKQLSQSQLPPTSATTASNSNNNNNTNKSSKVHHDGSSGGTVGVGTSTTGDIHPADAVDDLVDWMGMDPGVMSVTAAASTTTSSTGPNHLNRTNRQFSMGSESERVLS